MVDRILKMDGNKITGVKNVTMNEPYFQGHFPGIPSCRACCSWKPSRRSPAFLMMTCGERGTARLFMSAENVKWRKPVMPGDALVIEVELMKTRGKICKAKGVCKVGGEIVSEAEVTFMLRDAE